MNFDNHLFRSHMVAKIVNFPKPLSKTDLAIWEKIQQKKELGKELTDLQKYDEARIFARKHEIENNNVKFTEAQKKLLREEVIKAKYNCKEVVIADALEKGLMVEKETRDFISEVLGYPLIADNERRSNQWVTGKRDIKFEITLDIKTSKTRLSFYRMIDEDYKESQNNIGQANCYMELWGNKEALIIHALMDSPIYQVEREIQRLCYTPRLFNEITNEFESEALVEIQAIVNNHIITERAFDEFLGTAIRTKGDNYVDFKRDDFPEWNETPKKERLHMVSVNYDQNWIDQRNECIKYARSYMNEVKPMNNLVLFTQ